MAPAVRDYRAIAASPLFDAEWYLANNPDVAAAKVDPALHYLRYGAKEGRAPGPLFDGRSYLQMHGDVAATGINPLLHFIFHGSREGRRVRTELPVPRDITSPAHHGHLQGPSQEVTVSPHLAKTEYDAQTVARRILVADYRIPRPDLSAGETATVGILRDLCALGYDVTFIPDRHATLTRLRQQPPVNRCPCHDP